ncbi:hypothetical protein LCGC14_2202160, partial [marine sediment metagenome]
TVDSSDNIYIVGRAGLVKFNSSGFLEWIIDGGDGVTVDSSDNIYIVRFIWRPGGEDRHISLFKYDSSGIKQWNQTWGESEVDRGWNGSCEGSGGGIFQTLRSNIHNPLWLLQKIRPFFP